MSRTFKRASFLGLALISSAAVAQPSPPPNSGGSNAQADQVSTINGGATRLVMFVEGLSATDFNIDPTQFAHSLTVGADSTGMSQSQLAALLAGLVPTPAQTGSMTRLIDQTQADYCHHQSCGEIQNEFFLRIGTMWSPAEKRGEHAMNFQTAKELFPDKRAATLARAACDGDAAAVAAEVRGGADPNASGNDGFLQNGSAEVVTPLLWAIDCKNLTGIEALLDAGADPNRSGKYGVTPVTEAADSSDPAILALLLKRGGNPNAQTERETALGIALTHGADQEADGAPAMQAWANWQALLSAGANVNQMDGRGQTVMFNACARNRYDKVLQLIELGYHGDPVVIGRYLTTSLDHFPPALGGQMPWVEKVKIYLAQKGVRMPVQPLIQMKKDSNGYYIQATPVVATFSVAGVEFKAPLPDGYCIPTDKYIGMAQLAASKDIENTTVMTAYGCDTSGVWPAHALLIKTPKNAPTIDVNRQDFLSHVGPQFERSDFATSLISGNDNDFTRSIGTLSKPAIKPIGKDDICAYLGGTVAVDDSGEHAPVAVCETTVHGHALNIYAIGPGGIFEEAPKAKALALSLIQQNEQPGASH